MAGNAGSACPTLSLLHMVGKRWTIPIIEALDSNRVGGAQFNMLQAEIGGITPRNLSSALKELAAEGLVAKAEYRQKGGGMVNTEYFLTTRGRKFRKFILEAKELGISLYGVTSGCTTRKCTECSLFYAKSA